MMLKKGIRNSESQFSKYKIHFKDKQAVSGGVWDAIFL